MSVEEPERSILDGLHAPPQKSKTIQDPKPNQDGLVWICKDNIPK